MNTHVQYNTILFWVASMESNVQVLDNFLRTTFYLFKCMFFDLAPDTVITEKMYGCKNSRSSAERLKFYPKLELWTQNSIVL